MAKTVRKPTIASGEMKSYAKYGSWAFLLGLLVSIVAAFVSTGFEANYALVLGVLGLIVGLVNVTDKEVQLFLIAILAFLVSANSLSTVVSFVPSAEVYLRTILGYVIVFMSPAAAVVSLRALYDISKEQ